MFSNKEFEQKVLSKLEKLEKQVAKLSTTSQVEKIEQKTQKQQDEIQRLTDNHLKQLEMLQGKIHDIQVQLSSFDKSVRSFENTKNKLDSIITQQVQTLVKKSISQISQDMSSFEDVKKQISEMSVQIKELEKNMNQFRQAAKSVKEIDFTLHKHAKDLALADNTKIRLERENEKLKLLMAKMKRRSQP